MGCNILERDPADEKSTVRAPVQERKMNKNDVIWLRPTYTQRPNFWFACQVLRFDAARRGHPVREPRFEYSSWEPESHTFTLADERGDIARMSFLRRTIRWRLVDDTAPSAHPDEAARS
jgi:hypothetical protein